ncbi:LamG-like jellyroll fold domain-containing protein [Algihabitans albus]|uniref:LamG-like jellyroll fold domain-containing protein n=1 Tax=Algihabitans albus TaxID=2164067 RepID=UPI0013C30CCB|nr:LamG-like jellyroll fold domain-containing protein [Algihabitans albus]
MTAYQVSNTKELMNALAQAEGGDQILLAPGEYDDVMLHGVRNRFLNEFDSPVTITSSDPDNPAEITRLRLHEVSNVHFENIEFNYTFSSGDMYRDKPFHVTKSDNISFSDSTFTGEPISESGTWFDGYGAGFGLSVEGSSNISVVDNSFDTFFRAAVFGGVKDLTVVGNEVTKMSSDGFNFVAVNNVTIEENHFHDFSFNPESQAHMDMIQFWTSGTGSPTTDVVIRGNIMDSSGGDRTQSIFMRNEEVDTGRAGQEMYYQNILIEDNVIHNAHSHGITVGATDGLVIRDNTIVRNAETDPNARASNPVITSNDESFNVEIYNNILPGSVTIKSSADGNAAYDNIRTQSSDPTADNYVQNVFVNALGGETTSLEDLQVIPGSIADGAGAPLSEFEGTPEELIAAIRMPEATVMEGRGISFDASFSRDADGFLIDGDGTAGLSAPSSGAATFEWTIYDVDGKVVHQSSGPKLDYGTTEPGEYTAELTVTQPNGQSAKDSTQFTVDDANILDVNVVDGVATDTSSYGAKVSVGSNGAIAEAGDISVVKMTESTVVSVARGPQMFGLDSFTIDFGLQRGSETSGTGEIFRMHLSKTITLREDGELAFSISTQEGSFQITTSGAGLSDTDWHHVSVSYASADEIAQIYVDGTLVGSGEVTGLTQEMASWGPTLGNPWRPSFSGYISDLSMSANAATEEEVQQASKELHAAVSGIDLPDVGTPNEPDPGDQGGLAFPDTMFAFDGSLDGEAGSQVSLSRNAVHMTDGAQNEYVDVTDGFISFGKNDAFFGASELSLFFDFQTNEANEGTARMFWNHMSYGVELVGDDKLQFQFFDGARHKVEVDGLDIAAGEWHKVGFALDTETGAFSAYLNGKMIAQETLSGVSIDEAAYWDVYAGGTPWGKALDGSIDNLAVYHDFVDEEQAKSLSPNTDDILVA